MGQRHGRHRLNQSEIAKLDPDNVTPEHFEIGRVLGKGSFGRVYAVERLDTEELFAMKVLEKGRLLDENKLRSVLKERDLMSKLSHPLIVNLHFALQTEQDLCLILDLMTGGDLRYHLDKHTSFSEDRVRFYGANIMLALEYLHTEAHVLHRDLKPANLLLDEHGYCHITDFNVAKPYNPAKRMTGVAGTRAYMAPEVYFDTQYGPEVDYWSLGVCLFEMTTGRVPFPSEDSKKPYQREHFLQPLKFPSGTSKLQKSFITGLLTFDARDRLNFRRAKEHPWMKGIDWEAMYNGVFKDVPWKPQNDVANVDQFWEMDEQFHTKKPRKVKPEEQSLFVGWDYNPKIRSAKPEGEDDSGLESGNSVDDADKDKKDEITKPKETTKPEASASTSTEKDGKEKKKHRSRREREKADQIVGVSEAPDNLGGLKDEAKKRVRSSSKRRESRFIEDKSIVHSSGGDLVVGKLVKLKKASSKEDGANESSGGEDRDSSDDIRRKAWKPSKKVDDETGDKAESEGEGSSGSSNMNNGSSSGNGDDKKKQQLNAGLRV